MKNLIAFFFLFFLTTYSFSQDVIVRKDGVKIQAKILEISSSTIKYRNFTQPDGPTRTISISMVTEIIYDDGQFEKFDEKVVQPETNTRTENEVKPDGITEKSVSSDEYVPKKKDPILKAGFFLDAVVGYANYKEKGTVFYDPFGNYYPNGYSKTIDTVGNIAISFRFGNKWYFGSNEKWRPGLQVNWLRLGIYIEPNNAESLFIGPKTFSLLNLGYANAIKFNETMGLEANITGGLNFEIDLEEVNLNTGIMINPEVKFRMNNLAIGFDYARIQGFENSNNGNNKRDYNIFSLSIGAKF